MRPGNALRALPVSQAAVDRRADRRDFGLLSAGAVDQGTWASVSHFSPGTVAGLATAGGTKRTSPKTSTSMAGRGGLLGDGGLRHLPRGNDRVPMESQQNVLDVQPDYPKHGMGSRPDAGGAFRPIPVIARLSRKALA